MDIRCKVGEVNTESTIGREHYNQRQEEEVQCKVHDPIQKCQSNIGVHRFLHASYMPYERLP